MRLGPWRIVGLTGALLVAGCARHAQPAARAVSIVAPVVSPVLAPLFPDRSPLAVFLESFDLLDPARWREVEVNGRTDYSIAEIGDGRSLKAHSHAGASVLLGLLRFDADTYEWLSWRWRVDQFVNGEDLSSKQGSDASARVYVYFDTPGFPWQKRNIDYVWSATLPRETLLSSAYSGASRIIVAESGVEQGGTWRTVTRNIKDDYRRCFSEEPPDVVAVGLMSDTDSTQTEAIAYFDDVLITREPPPDTFTGL